MLAHSRGFYFLELPQRAVVGGAMASPMAGVGAWGHGKGISNQILIAGSN